MNISLSITKKKITEYLGGLRRRRYLFLLLLLFFLFLLLGTMMYLVSMDNQEDEMAQEEQIRVIEEVMGESVDLQEEFAEELQDESLEGQGAGQVETAEPIVAKTNSTANTKNQNSVGTTPQTPEEPKDDIKKDIPPPKENENPSLKFYQSTNFDFYFHYPAEMGTAIPHYEGGYNPWENVTFTNSSLRVSINEPGSGFGGPTLESEHYSLTDKDGNNVDVGVIQMEYNLTWFAVATGVNGSTGYFLGNLEDGFSTKAQKDLAKKHLGIIIPTLHAKIN